MNQLLPDDRSERRRQVAPLREMIFRSFPPFTYSETIVAGGDYGPLSDDPSQVITADESLFYTLKGKRWTEIPLQFLDHHQGDFVLLTAQAFAAFIPAWLVFCIDNDFCGAEFIVYTFASRDPQSSSQIRQLSIEMFQALNPQQRRTLLIFLQAIAMYDPSPHIRDYAEAAAHTVDNLISVFQSNSI
jgi:hypothetical protein